MEAEIIKADSRAGQENLIGIWNRVVQVEIVK